MSLLEKYLVLKSEHAKILEHSCQESECLHTANLDESEAALERARLALAESDEARSWSLFAKFDGLEDEYEHELIMFAGSPEEALETGHAICKGMESLIDRPENGKIRVVCRETGEEESRSVSIKPGRAN